MNGKPVNPMKRKPVNEILDVGIRAINSLFTVGRGQRLGIIAGSGVGKSILLGMMTKFTEAEIVVVALIGERGRELGSFVSEVLNEETKKRTVIIAEAYRTAEKERGLGDAKSTAIYADAYGRDAEFYAFTRSLKAYVNSFTNKSDMLVIDPDSEFFEYFKNIKE